MIELEFTLDLKEFEQRWGLVLDYTTETRILDDCGAFMLNKIRNRFLREVDPDERPWLPSKAGIKRRGTFSRARSGKLRRGTGTLFKTGHLFRSIQLAPITPGAVETSIRTDVFYAPFHQFGVDPFTGRTRRPAYKPYPHPGIARRRFLGFNEGDISTYTKLLALKITRVGMGIKP